METFHGSQGPKVLAQYLDENESKVWRRPASSVWPAEKGGGARLFVTRLRVPARPSYKKLSLIHI